MLHKQGELAKINIVKQDDLDENKKETEQEQK